MSSMKPLGSRLPSRAVAVLAATAALVSGPALSARAEPLNATVFVRLIGQVKVLKGEDERAWREQLLNLREVEVGSGSGFIVSPHGWIVTNHHVITGEKFTLLVRGEKLEVSIDVSRIEVVLPSETPGEPGRRFDASVYAVDAELDLAVLRVGGNDLPYVALGDSDAVAPADAVTAIGYPFGRMLEIENPKSDAIPNPSVSTGGLSALRLDAAGSRRLLQVSTVLNPGNSGGPVVDSEGYAIGVAQSRLTNAAAIGFAIPINRVKELLQKYGLDSNLPVELLTMGGSMTNPAKGVSVRVPIGFEDRSPVRLRVDAAAGGANADVSSDHLVLRIDRLATTQSIQQLERALLTEGAFERFHATATSPRTATRSTNAGRVLAGHASGADSTAGNPLKIVYAILDLGREKLVARYAGAADTIAANRALLQDSLGEMEVTPLLTTEVTAVVPPAWDSRPQPGTIDAGIPNVAGWITEPGVPWQCAAGLPAPSAGWTMSPPGDFTVVLRVAWYRTQSKDLSSGARRCSPQPGSFGGASYASRVAAWGIDYRIDGAFIQRPDGVWQLEMITPAAKHRYLAALFSEWLKMAEPQP